MSVLILNAEIFAEQETRQLQDVLLAGGRVAWMSSPRNAASRDAASLTTLSVPVPDEVSEAMAAIAGSARQEQQIEEVIDAEGGALLPGLHDHHIHLLSLAESLRSVDVSQVADAGQLRNRLQAAASDTAHQRADKGWIRAVGYHESVAGDLTKHGLDEIVRNRPLRIQHASGAMWMLNTLGMELLGISETTPEAELDSAGLATGRLFRSDEMLRDERGLANSERASAGKLAEVGKMLANFGVTGVTDATPGYGDAEIGFFAKAVAEEAIPQRLTLMPSVGAEFSKSDFAASRLSFGPHKIILADHSLPAFSEVADEVQAAHGVGRPVAVHSVTRASLALLVAVLDEVGSLEGDRVEHASVAPPELVAELQRHKMRVVVQPHFIAERGDRYLKEVEGEDLLWLYRCRGFLDAGLRVAGGTDAPFGKPNPWLAMWAAVRRETQHEKQVMSPQERVAAAQARDLFLSPLDDPGGKPRRVREGMAADLCLLHEPWDEVARSMPENPVRSVWIGGQQGGTAQGG